jgi:galactose mutarotase-like enzyme
MEYTIKNDVLALLVKQKGAELCSINDVATGTEYIWDANPAIWGSHSPVLFPIIGCLKENSYLHNGNQYTIPKHGFIRDNENINLESQAQNALTFILESSADTYTIYPFQFKFFIQYMLEKNRITITHTVSNIGTEKMFFSLGGHPAFKCPLNKNEKFSDYYLEFEADETALAWGPLENGLIGPKTRSVIDMKKFIYLNDTTFNKGALVFKNLNSSSIMLVSKSRGPILNVKYRGFPYLGIWSKPGAPFVCIEPWLGIADSWDSDRNLQTKEGILALGSGKSFEIAYCIGILN